MNSEIPCSTPGRKHLGPRQDGKVTLFGKLVEGMRHLVLINEAQFVPGIGRVIKRMIDSGHNHSRLIVTGSSSRTQHEVDFLEVLNGKVRAFECKSGAKTKTTSIRAFERAYPETKVTVVTPDNIDTISDEEATKQ